VAHTLLGYGNNLEVVKQGRKGQRDLLIIPVIEGHDVELRYNKGKLITEGYSKKQKTILKNCAIPKNLYESTSTWGGFRIKELSVHCKLSHDNLIATHVTSPLGEYHNQITNLNIMDMKGFTTPLKYVCWINFTGCEHRREMESALQKRLVDVNKFVSELKEQGKALKLEISSIEARSAANDMDMEKLITSRSFQGSAESQQSYDRMESLKKRLQEEKQKVIRKLGALNRSYVGTVKYLQVCDAINFRPTVKSVRVQSLYKRGQ
jgi:hypothetical protein